ncbi:hypothetical protein HZB60_00730 [candidate division KSB1 bacterium]|nr:hypothetical protein [candidate division KSB1 bacterium]
MRSRLPVWLLSGFAFVVFAAGCGPRESVQTTPAPAPESRPAPPRRIRDSQFDDRFLNRQALRAGEVREQLNEWKQSASRHKAEIRELVLKRKGELLFIQKDIRNNQYLLAGERDSLLSPLDSEAIELAEELITLK